MKTIKTILNSKLILYLALAVMAFFFFRQCEQTRAERQSKESAESFLNDTISYYTNELGQEVAEKITLQGDKESLQVLLSKQVDSTEQLKNLVEKFRSVGAAGNVTTVTRLDSIFIPYSGAESDPEHNFRISNRFYSLSGQDLVDGIRIDHLEIPNTLSFAIGKKKTGWFQSEYRIETVNSNPHVKTTGLDSYILKVPQKRLGLSLYAGYDFFALRPSGGVALTWNLFRF